MFVTELGECQSNSSQSDNLDKYVSIRSVDLKKRNQRPRIDVNESTVGGISHRAVRMSVECFSIERSTWMFQFVRVIS